MDVIKAVKTLLTDAGVTTPIKLNRQPDTPVEVITIINTGGTAPDMELGVVHEPTFQLLIRAADYTTANGIAQACRAALHGKIAVEAEGVHFLSIGLLAEPGSIGQDDNGHDEFSANFKAKARTIA